VGGFRGNLGANTIRWTRENKLPICEKRYLHKRGHIVLFWVFCFLTCSGQYKDIEGNRFAIYLPGMDISQLNIEAQRNPRNFGITK